MTSDGGMEDVLRAVGVEVNDGQSVRGAFDAAYAAADKAETLQRLDGLTKALPVAAIYAQPEHAAVEAVRTLVKERDAAVAAWRAVCAERDALKAELDAARQRASDAGWAADVAREQYERDHSLDWR